MLRQITYGTAAERPTVGQPGALFVIHSDSNGDPISPRLSIYDGYNRDWVDVSVNNLELLEGAPTAGTATASKGALLSTGAEMDVWNFKNSHEIGDVLYKYQDHEITTGELLALNATPQQITDGPAATEFIVFDGAWIWYDYNAAAYGGIAAGEDLTITYEGAGAEVGRCETTGFLDQTADEVRWVPPLAPAIATAAGIDGTALLGKHLEIALLTAEITTGDSPLKIRTFYHVVPSTLS
jgi:hypothetical protein